jgi:hypothetical protein
VYRCRAACLDEDVLRAQVHVEQALAGVISPAGRQRCGDVGYVYVQIRNRDQYLQPSLGPFGQYIVGVRGVGPTRVLATVSDSARHAQNGHHTTMPGP